MGNRYAVCLVLATNTQLIIKVRVRILTFGLRRPASPGMRRTRLRYSLTSLSGFPPADDKKPKAISTFARASHTSLRLPRNSDNICEHTAELIGTCQSKKAKVLRIVQTTKRILSRWNSDRFHDFCVGFNPEKFRFESTGMNYENANTI